MQQPHTQYSTPYQQQHYPPPVNTAAPQQYAGHSPHQLRTPSHLTTSTSTPAMAVVSHSVDTSSPSPSQHSYQHSQQQQLQRMRDSQQQQRARSYSSTQPPAAALTHSTPSPLSSSALSSASSSTERWVRECLLKCCQLVLHNRLLLAESEHQLAVNKSFNLHTPEAGVTHSDWVYLMRGREGDVIVLDIVLKGGGRGGGPALLERWSLHHDMDELTFHTSPLSSSASSAAATASRRVDPTLMFKRMLLLCRSLYSYVRLLPAASVGQAGAHVCGVWQVAAVHARLLTSHRRFLVSRLVHRLANHIQLHARSHTSWHVQCVSVVCRRPQRSVRWCIAAGTASHRAR